MEISNYIIATIWFLGVLWWDIWSDYKRWKLKIPINHTDEWVLRAVLLLPAVLLLVIGDVSIQKFVAATFLVASAWWEFFDGFYNKIRGFSWRFNGTVDPDDSWLDSILHTLKPVQELILKWGLIIVFTILYILL